MDLPLSESAMPLRAAFDRLQRASRSQPAPDRTQREHAIDALCRGIFRYEQRLVDAVDADFGHRSAHETKLLELFPLVDEARHTKRRLGKWMRPRSVGANWQFFPSRARLIYQPVGVVGIIGAWNYPILLTLSPLVGALAAGNRVLIKPSELAPATAEVIRQMIAELYPPEYVSVVTGGPEASAAFSALPFDHLIFTGSGRVGKLVMKAAADNLTPVTLELGGKSPALIHRSFPADAAADRICSAKFWNAGQTCVAPDYVLVHEDRCDEFVAAAQAAVARHFPHLRDNPDYTHMISEAAAQRMHALADDAAAKGARVLPINPAGEAFSPGSRVFPPTLVLDANDSMEVLQQELFGPILPVIRYRSIEEALDYINARPRPLALYYFDRDNSRVDRVLHGTVSGGVTVNDCIFHLPQHNLPFGGVGPSGMGAYHGFDGFATFSKKKGVLLQSGLVASVLAKIFTPPYGKWTDRLIALLLRRS